MSETNRVARHYALEGLVIVAGVLIALGADALWSFRSDRVDEQVALRQLDAELDANAVQLASVGAGHRRGLEAATSFLSVVRGTTTLSTDSIRTLLRTLDMAWTYNPKFAALESVIQSGRLGLIRDDALRVELTGWPGVVEDFREEEEGARRYTQSVQFAALSEVINWGDVYGPESGRGVGEIRIAGDENLESVIAYRHAWFEEILLELEVTEAVLARVRTLLADNLAGG